MFSIEFEFETPVCFCIRQAIQRWSKDENFPSVFVFGSATHSIKNSNNSAEALFHYTRNLTVLRPVMDILNSCDNKEINVTCYLETILRFFQEYLILLEFDFMKFLESSIV